MSIAEIPVSVRRACVHVLTLDGLSRRETALLMRASESTITRDRRVIRKENALRAEPGLADELAGEFLRQSESLQDQMRRISRDPKATPAVRLSALKACFQTSRDTMKLLQSMGYLPTVKPQTTPGPAPGSDESRGTPGPGDSAGAGGASGDSGGFGCDENTGVPMDDALREACGPETVCWKYPAIWIKYEIDPRNGRRGMAVYKQECRPCARPCQPPPEAGITNPRVREEPDPDGLPPAFSDPPPPRDRPAPPVPPAPPAPPVPPVRAPRNVVPEAPRVSEQDPATAVPGLSVLQNKPAMMGVPGFPISPEPPPPPTPVAPFVPRPAPPPVPPISRPDPPQESDTWTMEDVKRLNRRIWGDDDDD
jgi:hypothetical protein